MSAIVWQDVVDIIPDMSMVSVATQTVFLLHVNTALDVRRFSDGETDARLRLARIYLAAHFAANGMGGTSDLHGNVTAEAAGSLSRSYEGSLSDASSDALLDSTPWGRLYRFLMRPLGGGFAI